jgi:hypothetical protein
MMKPPVTAHAVLRYITRVLGYNLRPEIKRFGRDGSSWDMAKAAAARLNMTVEDIQLTIAPPALWANIQSGMLDHIRYNGLTLIIRGAQVVTIKEMQHGRSSQKTKILTRAEFKSEKGRSNRRFARGVNA